MGDQPLRVADRQGASEPVRRDDGGQHRHDEHRPWHRVRLPPLDIGQRQVGHRDGWVRMLGNVNGFDVVTDQFRRLVVIGFVRHVRLARHMFFTDFHARQYGLK